MLAAFTHMPLDPQWKPIAAVLPDARALRSKNEKKHKLLGWMEEIFCVNCGESGGMISREWAAHVFYLCDLCVETHGHVPLVAIPEADVRNPLTRPPNGQLVQGV
jgi:hypothetical protein